MGMFYQDLCWLLNHQVSLSTLTANTHIMVQFWFGIHPILAALFITDPNIGWILAHFCPLMPCLYEQISSNFYIHNEI